MKRYIIRDGNKIELTYEDEQTLLKQEHIELAIGAISNNCEGGEKIISELDESDLVAIGEEIYDRTWSNNGVMECDVCERWGFIN